MGAISYEIDRKVSQTEESGVVRISTSDILPKCLYAEDKEVKLFAFHETHSPFQRSSLGSAINRGLRDVWVKYHLAKKEGATALELGAMIPAGQVILGTINSTTLARSQKLVIVDGQQRLSMLKAAEHVVGEPIEVELPAQFISKSTPEELARHYMRYNLCNPMGKKDFIAGAICSGKLSEFVAKVDAVRAKGVMVGCDIGIRPSKSERLKRHTFDYHQVLTWLFYGLCDQKEKSVIINKANDVSELAIERVCKVLSAFDSIIGYKAFRGHGKHHFNCYSSESFMGAICRLALVEELDGGGWLNEETLSFWFNELSNTGHVNGRPTLGQEWWEYATLKAAGGNTAKTHIYNSFLRHLSQEDREKGIRKLGIPIARPNERYCKKYAKPGFGHSPEEGRFYFEVDSDALEE